MMNTGGFMHGPSVRDSHQERVQGTARTEVCALLDVAKPCSHRVVDEEQVCALSPRVFPRLKAYAVRTYLL